MEPIISPWLIYVMSIFTCFKILFAVITFVFGFATACAMAEEAYEDAIKCLILTVASTIIAIVIPTKETIISMIVASYITPDNLNMANELVKSNLNDYINIITNGINQVK